MKRSSDQLQAVILRGIERIHTKILVTGGAGFIGSNFVHHVLERDLDTNVITLDALTYAGSLINLEDLESESRHSFIQGDISNTELVTNILSEGEIDIVVHFAAESHVDKSIMEPAAFIQTNIVGTFSLLEAVRLSHNVKKFVHISTDEVFGSITAEQPAFTESSPYLPNSPYSASKASADHLVRSYFATYSTPAVVVNSSNNYGPRQFPEKLIPLMITQALEGGSLPVYGDGRQVRDWVYVDDCCEAIYEVMTEGFPGETFNIGGEMEVENIEVVGLICSILDEVKPLHNGASYRDQILYVEDRPGHDRRYAIDITKINRELGWSPSETIESGLRKTIDWYLGNTKWLESVTGNSYESWMTLNYSNRRAGN